MACLWLSISTANLSRFSKVISQHFREILKGQKALQYLFIFFVSLIPNIACSQSPFSSFNPAIPQTNSMVINVNAFTANNVVPLKAIFFDEDWDDPIRIKNRNNLDIFWKADAGIIYKGWRLAGFYRGELFLSANKDTVEILRMIRTKQKLPAGKTFNIDLEATGFSAKGIEISKNVNCGRIIEGLSIGATARYMKGEMIQAANINGVVTPTGTKTYDFDLSVDYNYDINFLYKRRDMSSPEGYGYGFDIGLSYIFSDKIKADILFMDLFGRMHWRNVPYTTADVTSRVREFDEDGYMKFRPTIRGFEGFRDFEQKIPIKTDMTVKYDDGSFILGSTINFIGSRPLYWINGGYRLSDNFAIDADYNTNYKAIGLGLIYRESRLRIYSDNVNWKKAGAMGLIFSFVIKW